jgi:hypothetical protein
MICDAIFSPDRVYRYRLSRVWRPAALMVVWLLLNPSTADESRDDPTIRRCMGYSINWGFGGCIIHNLFAYRSTYPEELVSIWCKDPIGPDNDAAILADAKNCKVICGWGNNPVTLGLAERPKKVTSLLAGCDLNYLKLTSLGQPQHPLYLHHKLRPIPL